MRHLDKDKLFIDCFIFINRKNERNAEVNFFR